MKSSSKPISKRKPKRQYQLLPPQRQEPPIVQRAEPEPPVFIPVVDPEPSFVFRPPAEATEPPYRSKRKKLPSQERS